MPKTTLDSRASDQVFKSLMNSALAGFVADGTINPHGKTADQLRGEVLEFLRAHAQDIRLVTDHTADILRQARAFRRSGSQELACLFYALGIEHTLNKLVSSLAMRKALQQGEIELLIRDTSHRSKATWLLLLLGIRPLKSIHAERIAKLMEVRNAFVHYKWKPESQESEKGIEAILEGIERTVTYMQRFEAKYLLEGSKRRLKVA